MKKFVFLFLIFVWLVPALFAQVDQDTQESVYFKTYYITKIYTHPDGYKVRFMKTDLESGIVYIPKTWFEEAGGKAELIWGYGDEYPYFIIFWKNGKFDHIRLFVIENMTHASWGLLIGESGIEEKFNVEEPVLEY